MPEGTTESSNGDGYWYDRADPTVLAVLEAVRRHREAEAVMRRRARDDMDMGDTDLAALRWIIREERAGRDATSAALARELAITTAAATKLVGRLVASGYLERARHPSDRRIVLLSTRPGVHERIRRTMGPMHEQMLQLAASLAPAERATVVDFLDRLSRVVAGDHARGRGRRG
ncbi:MarR family winged helix-turn-helix transcriptional regulator [Agromyces bauzanensis]